MPGNKHRPAIDEARELMALVGALRADGDTVEAEAVAARLGVGPERAQRLVDLLTEAGGDSYASALPLALDDDNSVTLMAGFANATRGRSLRLTAAEARALEAAFDAIGLDGTDDLRARITAGYWPETAGAPDMASLVAAGETAGDPEVLTGLARAILAGKAIEFAYTPTSVPGAPRRGAPLRRRHAGPVGLRHEGDRWYLDAYDLDRQADRHFRLDRMSGLAVTEHGWQRTSRPSTEGPRLVGLTFTDRTLIDLFDWHGLRVLARRKSGVECEIAWYPGSQWLPRHIAASGAGVKVDDPELARAAAGYAADLRELCLGA